MISMPWFDVLAVVLVFWGVHQPRRMGMAPAFVLGLLMDVHQGALLGQHALAYSLLSFSVQDGHDHDQSRDEQRDRRGQGRARTDLAALPLFRGHVVVFEGPRQAGFPRVVRRGQHVTVGPVALSVTGAGLPRLSAHEFSPLTNSLRPPFMVHIWGGAGQDHRPHGQL